MKKGKVYLVGAGPGDPGLLTTKARDILVRSDVIVYDRLIARRILQELPKHIVKIYVGKRSRTTSIPGQDAIPRILVSNAQKGKLVVRLKGGDPFLFGRGGEEIQRLRDAGIDFEVVPGITSALAVPAYAGIPVTHRKLASSVAIVTGHGDSQKSERVDWKKLATAVDTIVILMGVDNLQYILKRLVEGGCNIETPVAIIERGTTKRQRVTVGTIRTITAQAVERRIMPPAVIVVGNVVKLQKELSWFKS
jgi:uroporphyrin-III C-methyltransferase